MKYDIFFSICQTDIDGYMPNEAEMFKSFFEQVVYADQLGYDVAWVAETHLSCEIQKTLPTAVIPHFKGEIGLNTDILQLAHLIFARTKRIEVGSAVRNILCNGGPLAHAESVLTFLSLHGLNPAERRRLHLGFAAGRFDFSNRPYGIVPRNTLEKIAWPVVKGKIFAQATEIFLRALRGDVFSSDDLRPVTLHKEDFRSEGEWERVKDLACGHECLSPFWQFEKVGVIPREARLELLNLTVGTHDAKTQVLANEFLPTGVFNLSITPPEVIEATHSLMREKYHQAGGQWRREYMPRTAMVFLDMTPGLSDETRRARATSRAENAWKNYWHAMEGTIDNKKVQQAVKNALAGTAQDVALQIREKYHPEDRLMLWFDFNTHDNELIKNNMKWFMEHVVPELNK